MSEKAEVFYYQYCSMSTFVSMMKEHKIWLADPMKMNDYEEIIGILEKVKEYIIDDATYNDAEKEIVVGKIDSIAKTLNADGQEFLFISCFSSDRDLLSQWFQYGDKGNGVAVGFNLDKIKAKDSHLSVFDIDYIDNRKYVNNNKSKISKKVFDAFYNALDDVTINNSGKAGGIGFMKTLEEAIKYKNSGFSAEKERRLLYTRYKTTNGEEELLPVKYVSHEDNNIKAHVELEFDIDDIGRIILGPKCRANKTEIVRMIKNYFGEDIKGKTNSILKSKTPLR